MWIAGVKEISTTHAMNSFRLLLIIVLTAACLWNKPAFAAPGDVDSLDLNIVGSSGVSAIAEQPDGKFIIAGDFTSVLGVPRSNIARINADGTLDASFDPKTSSFVESVAVQGDGKIVIAGNFTTLQPNGAASPTTRNRIARVNADGTLDLAFDPNANDTVSAVAIEPSGSMIIGGRFNMLQPNGAPSPTAHKYIARINADGTHVASFNPNPSQVVTTLALQPDGMVLLGGIFTTLQPNGAVSPTTRNRIARVNADGTLDTFDPNASSQVDSIAVQPDGKVLFGGLFTSVRPNGAVSPTTRTGIARVNADGTLDASFDVRSTTNVYGFCLQADGKMVITGQFGSLQGTGAGTSTPRDGIGRVDAGGVVDAFDPNASGSVFGAAVRGDGKVLVGGFFTGFQPNGAGSVTPRNKFARLENDAATQTLTVPDPTQALWQRGGSATHVEQVTFEQSTDGGANWTLLGAGSRVGATADWQLIGLALGTGSIRVRGRTLGGNAMGSTGLIEQVTAFDFLTAPGNADALDANLVVGDIYATVVQPDGKIVFGGHFTSVLGTPRNNIARLNADGTLDAAFDPNVNGAVATLAVQADGKLLLGGEFSTLQPNGAASPTTRNRVARVNADGSLDTVFDPNASAPVISIVVQPDGKVLLSGDFGFLQPNGAASPTTRVGIGRVNADGTLDTGFDPNAGSVQSMALQADGKVLLGGQFTELRPNGAASATPRQNIARVNGDGTLDTGFDPKADNTVFCVAVQADGKVLLGGAFTTLQPNGAVSPTTRNHIARVNADGTLDTGFDPSANNGVFSMAVQTDGRVVAGGAFTSFQPNGAVSPTTRNRIAQINPDGTLDPGFDPNADERVFGVTLQADGKVLLGGVFTTLQPNGAASPTTRNFLARVSNDPATQDLAAPSDTQVLWTRAGAGPEIARATFALSTDGGANWSPLAGVARVGATSDWQATGLALPTAGLLRARGWTSAGYANGSSGLIEQIATFGAVTSTVINTGGTVIAPNLPGAQFFSFTAPDVGVSGGRIQTTDGRKLDAVFNEQGEVLLHGTQVMPVDPTGGAETGTILKLMPPTGDAVLATIQRGAAATAANDQVIFTGLMSDDPQPAVRKGQEIPGLPGVFLKSFLTLDGNGATTFFSGKLRGAGVNATNDTAIFSVGPAGFAMLVRKGMDVGDEKVKIVATLVGQAGSLAEGRWRGGRTISACDSPSRAASRCSIASRRIPRGRRIGWRSRARATMPRPIWPGRRCSTSSSRLTRPAPPSSIRC